MTIQSVYPLHYVNMNRKNITISILEVSMVRRWFFPESFNLTAISWLIIENMCL